MENGDKNMQQNMNFSNELHVRFGTEFRELVCQYFVTMLYEFAVKVATFHLQFNKIG